MLLCRNETYRKVEFDFSICLIGIFLSGDDFLKNGAAVLKNLVDFLEKLAAILGNGRGESSPVALVAFPVALLRGQFAPVNITKPAG